MDAGRPAHGSTEGVLLIDKPPGLSSHAVVAAIRRALGGPRTGHAGTLDPFATGLLLILLGRATRIQRHLVGLDKSYSTVARLGARSSTGDPEGEIEITGRLPPRPPALPTGEIRQRPPAHSAIKVRGERAYRRARRGESFEMPERLVRVTRFQETWREPTAPDGTALAGYEIECSSGTYVRSLIMDLRDAYCVALRRTAVGPFSVEHALRPPLRGETWSAPEPLPIADALARVGLDPAHVLRPRRADPRPGDLPAGDPNAGGAPGATDPGRGGSLT